MNISSQRVLVTGATGFIGEVLCRHLVGRGMTIVAMVRNEPQAELLKAELDIEVVQGDLTDVSSLNSCCKNIDTIIHLAGIAHVRSNSESDYAKINTQGTADLISSAVKADVNRLVFLSSSLAADPETEANDRTAYGDSKWQAEQLLQQAQNAGQIETVILRPVNVYGKGMKGNIAAMISMIDRGRLPPLPKLSNRLSLLGVDDLAEALLLAMKSPTATGKTYLVTDGQGYGINEIEAAIYAALKKEKPSWHTPAVVLYAASWLAGVLSALGLRGGSISSRTYSNLTRDNIFSNEKICAELGFKPMTNLYAELPEIAAAITKQ